MRLAKFWILANVDRNLFSQPKATAASLDARLLIGFGNGLRSDDGAGLRAATLIAEQSPSLRVIIAQQLTPDLAEDIAAAAQVVFIDAYAAPETSARLRVERVFSGDTGRVSPAAHHGSPAGLMRLAREVFGAAPDAWVVGIPAYSFVAGEAISPGTSYWIHEAVALVGGCARAGGWKGD